MALDFDDYLSDDDELQDCDCEEDEQCSVKGCLFRIKVGPCTAFNKSTGLIDPQQMCTPLTATAHTPNFVRPLIDKPYRNACAIRRTRGQPDCSLDVDFDICETDPAMPYLLGDCPFSMCIIPNVARFDASQPVDNQTGLVLRGLFIGSDWTWNNVFQEDQSASRTFSCDGKIWGMREWLASFPTIQNRRAGVSLTA